MIHDALATVYSRANLSREQAADAMRVLMTGEAPAPVVAAFLTALHMKGETTEEITGFATTMREMATRVPTDRRPLVDTCGTGGDHSGTFNISTTAAFVVAGAGVAVAKHGNRSASSKCGSADVLETLGVNLDASPEKVGQLIDDIGIGFLFARALHGAMKHVGPIRQELRLRTVFNILGPLTNPAGATAQVMGVFDRRLVEPLAHVLLNLGDERAFVVHGSDGLDELTLGGPTFVAEVRDGVVHPYEIIPEDFGFEKTPSSAMAGGEADENAAILRAVLEGKAGPHRDIVLLNASAAIQAGGIASNWQEGIDAAAESIDSGEALRKLDALEEGSR
jgi:anthranilate phosphoribosyltransferase